MAGGIDWFRWHHGSATDPKFRVVAKQAGCKTAEVVAVWAFLLEEASENDGDRGRVDSIDFDAIDTAFDLEEGVSERIYQRMVARGLFEDSGRVASWDKRQPKREDDTAAERKRRQRERETEECPATSRNVTQRPAPSRNVTPGHDRGEESRVEEKKEDQKEGAVAVGNGLPASQPPANSPPSGISPVDSPGHCPKAEFRGELNAQRPTPGIVVPHAPPPLADGPWPADPATADPVEWLRQHIVFGDQRRIRDPALVVQQLRNGFPDLDLVEVFREASDYLRSGQTVTAGYERHLKRTAQFAAERKAKQPARSRDRSAPGRRPDSFTEADYAADLAEQEARRAVQNG